MRFKKFSTMVCLLVVTAVIHAPAVRAKGNDADKLRQLIVQSGFQKQFEVLPEFMGAMFAARLSKDKNATSGQGGKVREIIAQTFNGSGMSDAYRKEIDRGLSPKEVDAALAWFNSPLGTKIIQLEAGVSSGDAYKEMRALAAKADTDPAFAPRKNMLSELDGAAHLSEARGRMKTDIFKVMARFSDVLNGQTPSPDKELTARHEKQLEQMKTTAGREVLVSGLYIYRTLSNEELSQYLEFYKSPAGKKYAGVCRKAFAKVFANALRAAEKRIIEEFSKK